jgi:hypothetical protein
MSENFKEGLAIDDIYKNSWTLGMPIGRGGFGLIYLGKNFLSFNYFFFNIIYVKLIEV